eukprot:scaffold437154_cov55-Attheya_sp.AAC.1
MDVSLVAAVGSFVVSERVLRPKATLLIILGGVLAYDLSTKTQDAASLRIYRGTMHQDSFDGFVVIEISPKKFSFALSVSLVSVSDTN